MRLVFVRFLLFIVRLLLPLHYRIRIKNIEAVKNFKGGLIMPDHVALIDPVILMSHVWRYTKARPVAYTGQFVQHQHVMKLIRALPMDSTSDGASAWKVWKINKQKKAVQEALASGENILIYPSGQLRVGEFESLGGKTATFELMKQNPNAPILLVRIRGLRESLLSRFFTDGVQVPSSKHMLALIKKNWWKLLTRRVEVSLECERFDTAPSFRNARECNEWLEKWYHQTPDPLISGRDTWNVGGFSYNARISEHDNTPIDPSIDKKVRTHIANEANKKPGDIHLDQELVKDLGFDSLTTATFYFWIEEQFGRTVDMNVPLHTVRDVVLAASGVFGEISTKDDSPVPPRWIEHGRKTPLYPIEVENIPAAFLSTLRRMGRGRIAMGDERAGILTYGQTLERALMLSDILRELPGECVGIMLPASVAATITGLAVMLSGKVPAFLNWTNGQSPLDESIRLAEIKTILTSDAFLDKAQVMLSNETAQIILPLEEMRKRIGLSSLLKAKIRSRLPTSLLFRILGLHLSKKDDAVILFTSGSEKAPKGVRLTHGNILSNIDGALEAIESTKDDVMLGFLPPFHSFGLTLIAMLCLVGGVKTAFDADPKKYRRLARQARKWRATLIPGTPDFLSGIISAGTPDDFKTVRAFLAGAQKTPQSLRDRAQELSGVVLEGYGITETGPLVAVNRLDEPAVGVGRPIKNTHICIVHPETKTFCAHGTEGLILVRGPGVSVGYLGEVPFPKIYAENRLWYNTGDLGMLSSRGELIITGRLSLFLKSGGEMISIPAVEEALITRWPSNENGPVLTVHGEEREGETAILCLYTKDETITCDDANKVLKEAGFNPLSYVRVRCVLPEIPLLGTGKTNRRALPKPTEVLKLQKQEIV
ncbi:MAG: AMP-binding protein [Parcubacteria group bacterium]|nr:AMP-binding protein [Parcubacteria group bacterium]